VSARHLQTEPICYGKRAAETSPCVADRELGEHVRRELEILVDQPIGPVGQPPWPQTPRPSRAGRAGCGARSHVLVFFWSSQVLR
jgi:hypothetical protein